MSNSSHHLLFAKKYPDLIIINIITVVGDDVYVVVVELAAGGVAEKISAVGYIIIILENVSISFSVNRNVLFNYKGT